MRDDEKTRPPRPEPRPAERARRLRPGEAAREEALPGRLLVLVSRLHRREGGPSGARGP